MVFFHNSPDELRQRVWVFHRLGYKPSVKRFRPTLGSYVPNGLTFSPCLNPYWKRKAQIPENKAKMVSSLNTYACGKMYFHFCETYFFICVNHVPQFKDAQKTMQGEW